MPRRKLVTGEGKLNMDAMIAKMELDTMYREGRITEEEYSTRQKRLNSRVETTRRSRVIEHNQRKDNEATPEPEPEPETEPEEPLKPGECYKHTDCNPPHELCFVNRKGTKRKNDNTGVKGECIPADGVVSTPYDVNLKNLDPKSEPFVKEGGVPPNIFGWDVPPWLLGRLKKSKRKKKHTKKRKKKNTKQKKKKNTKRRR
jgi:hypothetical protein